MYRYIYIYTKGDVQIYIHIYDMPVRVARLEDERGRGRVGRGRGGGGGKGEDREVLGSMDESRFATSFCAYNNIDSSRDHKRRTKILAQAQGMRTDN